MLSTAQWQALRAGDGGFVRADGGRTCSSRISASVLAPSADCPPASSNTLTFLMTTSSPLAASLATRARPYAPASARSSLISYRPPTCARATAYSAFAVQSNGGRWYVCPERQRDQANLTSNWSRLFRTVL